MTRSRHATSERTQRLAAVVAALCVCAACAYAALAHAPLALAAPVQAADGQAASAQVADNKVDFASGDVSQTSPLRTQDMIGVNRRPAETIAINKAYSRDASEYDDQTYRFKSKGGAYVLKVNNKVEGSTSSFDPYDEIKGYLTASATKGKDKILFVGEWCNKGINTFELGTIKKGTTVKLSFYAYPRSSASKFSFKVVPIITKLTKKNTKIKVKAAKWTGKALKPAVTVKYKGKKLKKGTDYTVKYSNNKKIGKGTATITGKGNYKGTVKAKFTIKPKGYIYAAVYGGAMGGSPSSTPQVNLMAKTFTRLKVPGYKVKAVKSLDQQSFSKDGFAKLLANATEGATKNDLVFVYVNAHGTQVVNETTDFMGVTKTHFDHSPGIPTEGGVVTWKQLLDTIGASTKGKVFLATEVCFSGNLVNVVKKHSIKDRITIFTGASEDKTARSDNFTKRLATGLITLNADSKLDMNLKVTAKELYNYIKTDFLILLFWQQPKFYSCDKSFVMFK